MPCGRTTSIEPPFILDSARVIKYAETGRRETYTGKITVNVGGRWLDPVPRLAICENLAEDDILLLYCDEFWNVLAAGGGKTVEDVMQAAERAYRGVSNRWEDYRVLNAEETAELEALREDLRELSAQNAN